MHKGFYFKVLYYVVSLESKTRHNMNTIQALNRVL